MKRQRYWQKRIVIYFAEYGRLAPAVVPEAERERGPVESLEDEVLAELTNGVCLRCSYLLNTSSENSDCLAAAFLYENLSTPVNAETNSQTATDILSLYRNCCLQINKYAIMQIGADSGYIGGPGGKCRNQSQRHTK